MKNKTIIAILSILSISLAIITITMFITYISSKKDTDISEITKEEVDYNNHFFTRYLNFSKDQIELFKTINEYHIASKAKIGMQIGRANEEFSKKLINGNLSKEDENLFYQQIIQLHTNLQQTVYIYYTKIRSICNSEQKEKCDRFFKTTICINRSACGMLQSENGDPYVIMN